MSQTLLAWVNYAKTAAITATSSESGLPPENMINDIGAPSTGWQTAAGVTTATLNFTLSDPGVPIRVIALFCSNLSITAQITATITLASVETWTQTLAGPAVGYKQVVFVTTDLENADSVEIVITDTANTDGHINVPLVFIGPAWLPQWNASPKSGDGWLPETNMIRTRGGQVYPTLLSNPRTVSFEFEAMDPDETQAYAREIGRLHGMGINVLFIMDAEGSNIRRDAVFGLVSNPKPYGFLPGLSGVRTWGATITERL